MQFSLYLKTKLLFSVMDTFPLNFKTPKVEKPDISITLFPKKHPTATPSHPEHILHVMWAVKCISCHQSIIQMNIDADPAGV